MSEVQVSLVPTEHVQDVWPAVAGFIAEALEHTHGRYEPEDIFMQLASGGQMLWVAFEEDAIKGCVTTQISQYPRKRVLTCFTMGGDDFPLWKGPMFELLTKFALDNDCDDFEATGRPGWARVFKNEGCKTVWQTCSLPLVRS